MTTFRTSKIYAENLATIRAVQSYLQDASGQPTGDATRLGIVVERIVELNVLETAAAAIHNEYTSPETQTSIVILQMKNSDKAMMDNYRALRKSVANSEVVKTENDYMIFAIPVPTSRTPATIPTEPVLPTLAKNERGGITVRGARVGSESGQLTNPENTLLIIMICILDIGMPEPAFADYELYRTTSKNREVLHFTPGQSGKAVWVVMAFTNSAGRGPWSRAVRFIIL